MTQNMLPKNPKWDLTILLTALFLYSCSGKNNHSLLPEGYESQRVLSIENGNLNAVFVDNSELSPLHKAGYNGIARLNHSEEDSVLFVPDYAGFNLEHIFGGDSLQQLFEPRLHPMTLFRKTEDEVLLYQEPTPISHVESLTSFKLVKPHYIDITFQCIVHDEEFFQHGYAGFFWASYIQNPVDKKIYFKGVVEKDTANNAWISAWSEEHGVNSTHRSIKDNHEFFFAPNFNAKLASHFSQYRYSQPYYFGRFGKMVLAYFFDAKEIIRFSQSPTGGGEFNPAWDFQYIIPSPETGKKYSLKVRMVYKPYISGEDISDEFEKWKKKN
ncbi:MAG: hypothetical protein ABIR06_15425 [Cyclobacteriaceae bacterium]